VYPAGYMCVYACVCECVFSLTLTTQAFLEFSSKKARIFFSLSNIPTTPAMVLTVL